MERRLPGLLFLPKLYFKMHLENPTAYSSATLEIKEYQIQLQIC